MHDPRVFRGNTISLRTRLQNNHVGLVIGPYKEAIKHDSVSWLLQVQDGIQGPRATSSLFRITDRGRQKNRRTRRNGTPPPNEGREHVQIQTELYLEEVISCFHYLDFRNPPSQVRRATAEGQRRYLRRERDAHHV